MLLGSFDAYGRPNLDGLLIIRELNLVGLISFRVDTGSDTTVLAPTDARNTGVDLTVLRESNRTSIGIGGEVRPYSISAEVLFIDALDGGKRYSYPIDLSIYRPQDVPPGLPSLLGQDVLKHWAMHHSPSTNELSFEV